MRKVLYENAADVYHLDLEALQPHFERVGFEVDEPVAAPRVSVAPTIATPPRGRSIIRR